MTIRSSPRFSLSGICWTEYLKFQEEIIVRRTKYDLKKAMERAHLLEGLLVAQDNIDEVIHIIRTSYDNAKENLMTRFSLDEVQAQAILDMLPESTPGSGSGKAGAGIQRAGR